MKYCLANCIIYTGEEVLKNKAVIIKKGKIESIIDTKEIPKDVWMIDLKGLNIAPGFIDLQINGGGGYLFNDSPTPEVIYKIFEAHKHFGVTGFLPTMITTNMDKIFEAIDSVKLCMMDKQYGVLGLHIEGPFINITKAGVHNRDYIRNILTSELKSIAEKGKGIIKMMTVAPELLDREHVEILNENGIIVSAGHSNTTYQGAIKCFDYGVAMVTHLFNAMSELKSREPGLVGATLDSDVWASIIVDGIHVDYATVRIAKKLKKDKLILISDAMPPAGSDVVQYKIGDFNVYCTNDRCITPEGILAGSCIGLSKAVKNCVNNVGIELDEALRMASTYPAQVIGMGNILGKIKPGYAANVVIFDDDINIKGTIVHGEYEQY